jgi:exonuclease SbcC
MQSSPETLELLIELQATLAGLLEGVTFTEEVLSEEHVPVVFMHRLHAITAFAVGDEKDYRLLYDAFKKHYLKHSAQWQAKDLAFVYCIPEGVDVPPEFCSQVEVDVYFCRKFAIRLDSNMDASLARLPFLPLAPITPGVQVRPPTAQTLLRQRNLKAELATALVLPQKSSAATILATCLANNYGPPHSLETTAAAPSSAVSKDDRIQTKLKSISIQNFRAYRKKKEFEFGSAVTVLYGPNGFGKTSFFDAIDFAVTGGIGRLKKASSGLAQLAKHLDCQDDTTEVALTLVRDGKEHVITRNLANHNHATMEGKSLQRKEVLSFMTGGAAPEADHVNSMVDLFRATHLFSQEDQELTRDVASKSELSYELVTKMLAFEDYARGLKKAEDVVKLAKQEHAVAADEIAASQRAIAQERAELERLQGLAAADTSPEVLDVRFAALEQTISSAGFELVGVEIRDTRGVRSMLESSAAKAVALRNTLARAVDRVSTLASFYQELEPLRTQLTNRQASLQQAQATETMALNQLNSLSTQLAELKSQEGSFQNRLEWFTWTVSVYPEYSRLNLETKQLAASLSALAPQATHQRTVLEQAQATQRQAVAALQTSEAALKIASDMRARVQAVKNVAALWEQSTSTFAQALDTEVQLQSSLEVLRSELGESQQAVQSQQLRLARAEGELEAAKSNDSRLKALISELRGHVDSPSCQLCGHDHGTTEALFSAIDQRLENGGHVLQLSEAAVSERLAHRTLVAQIAALSERVRQGEQRLEQTQTQRAVFQQQHANYAASLNSVGLSLTDESSAQLQSLSDQVHEGELLAAAAVGAAQQSLASAETVVASGQSGLQVIQDLHQTTDVALSAARKRLSELVTMANKGSVALGSSLQELTNAREAAEAQRAATNAAARSSEELVTQQKTAHAAAKSVTAAARTAHQQASQTWTSHQTQVQSILSELAAANFSTSVTQEELSQWMEVSSTREVSALSLRDQVAELEVAVDTAATSAAFQSMRQRIQEHEQRVQEATFRAQSIQPWIGYFTEVTKLLSTQQSFATDHFIEEYGPRTAVLQQRLRPVYGFDGIELTSNDKTISINVQRNAERLRPADYFSQSQVQTLILGLFLTACSSQTWSGFSSIMMDDPVTHFDDLNTYALLDLILGLQSSSEGERQFVISTCDEKLLQLARHKFRHLGSAAKFHRFQAIGADGPMVSELSA